MQFGEKEKERMDTWLEETRLEEQREEGGQKRRPLERTRRSQCQI